MLYRDFYNNKRFLHFALPGARDYTVDQSIGLRGRMNVESHKACDDIFLSTGRRVVAKDNKKHLILLVCSHKSADVKHPQIPSLISMGQLYGRFYLTGSF